MSFITNLISIVIEKIGGGGKDYFLPYKYDMIKEYYGKTCLDIGAGTAQYSRFLKDQGHDVTPIDVVDESTSGMEIKQFDGSTLPFEEDSVDSSIFMFVLHHTNTQIELLREAKRVTRNHIIIGEDIVENRLDKWMGNIHLNTSPWAKGVDTFHSEEGWARIFDDLGLSIIRKITIPKEVYPVYPVTRIIYVLSSGDK